MAWLEGNPQRKLKKEINEFKMRARTPTTKLIVMSRLIRKEELTQEATGHLEV